MSVIFVTYLLSLVFVHTPPTFTRAPRPLCSGKKAIAATKPASSQQTSMADYYGGDEQSATGEGREGKRGKREMKMDGEEREGGRVMDAKRMRNMAEINKRVSLHAPVTVVCTMICIDTTGIILRVYTVLLF